MGLTQKLGTIPLAIQTDSSNNVGIGGTPSGSFKLEVTGASKLSGFLGVNGSPATSFPFEAYINSATAYSSTSRGNVMRVYNSNTGANVFAGIELGGAGTANDGLAGINGIVTGSGSAALSFYTRNGGTFGERVRIGADGNVGIGSNNPGYPLIVSRTLSSEQTLFTLDNATNTQNNFGMNFTVLGYLPVAAIRVIYPAENNLSLAFFTYNGAGNVNERMRITQDGKALFGTTTAGYGLFGDAQRLTINPVNDGIVVAPLSQNFSAYTVQANNNTGTRYALYMANGSNGAVGNIAFTSSSTSYNTSSDYRLKEDLQEINGLDKISAIKVYNFKWKIDETRMDGVLAHELQDVIPYAVQGEKDGEQMQSVDYSKLVPILVKAIQELSAKVTALENL